MNKTPEELKYWIDLTDRLTAERNAFFENGINIAKERDDLKEVLENLLSSFKKFEDSEIYMELSQGFTQYNIKKAYEVLNKYKITFLRG
jgi:transcriptional antiterminator